jgi:paraquat-inducible protein A
MNRATALKACHCCGQIHRLPQLSAGQAAACIRCGVHLRTVHERTASRTAAAAMAAFILYWPAILLPILKIEKFGQHHESSLLGGTFELLRHGSWFVGLVVLLFSIVFPLVKIVLLLELSLTGILHRRHKALTYRIMEAAGRWSMLDVLLLALMVMLVKLGTLVEFHFGPAVWAFVFCVAMSIVASLFFDPHSIWDEPHG